MAKPKILFYDIETSPNLAYVWGKYEQDVIAYEKERELLSFAYKWQGGKVKCETREGKLTDHDLISSLWTLFQQADLIVAHNGDKFDQKRVKARMVYWGFNPTKILSTIDTLKIAKQYFAFNSNSLSDLSEHLKLGKKPGRTDFKLWEGCMKDDHKSWKKMKAYNKNDVVLLEKVYNKFLPWIQNHPNLSRLKDATTGFSRLCPNCGNDKTEKRGYRATQATIKQQMFCKGCKAWFLTRVTK